MIPQEKAKELVDRFAPHAHTSWHPVTGFDKKELQKNAKQCAWIAVGSILTECKRLDIKFNLGLERTRQYWEQVSEEIERL